MSFVKSKSCTLQLEQMPYRLYAACLVLDRNAQAETSGKVKCGGVVRAGKGNEALTF